MILSGLGSGDSIIVGQEELPWEISASEVKQLLDDKEMLLVDCREPQELEIAAIDGAKHLPMMETPQRIDEFGEKKDRRIIVFCHHGMRSLQVAQYLRNQGYTAAQSMEGGIDVWSLKIDGTVARY